MGQDRDNPFEFLKQAKAGALYRLLEKMTRDDSAMVLANMPPPLTAQILAYYPEEHQGGMLASMREARRAPPEAAEATVARMRGMLAASREELSPPTPNPGQGSPRSVPASGLPAQAAVSAYGRAGPAKKDAPQPWRPRTTDETPINVQPRPNRPPPVKGDPDKSPLRKLNILEFLGIGKGKASDAKGRAAAESSSRPSLSPEAKPKKDAEPRDGLVRNPGLRVSGTPRVLGAEKRPARPALPTPPLGLGKGGKRAPVSAGPPEGRKMDGMAILAAILRNASPDVRHNVATDSPTLFKALKERMFVFDDLLGSDDDALAQIFTIAPLSDAALALRFAPPLLRDRALRAVSPGRAGLLRDASPAGSGKAGLDDIEQAQNRIIGLALRLQSAGRLIIDPDDPDLAL